MELNEAKIRPRWKQSEFNSIHDYAILMLDPHGIVLVLEPGAQQIIICRRRNRGSAFPLAFYTPEDIAPGEPQHVL